MSEHRIKVLAIVPSAFCYGLQQITIEVFSALKPKLDSHFLVTRWNDGEFARRLDKHVISYSYSWLGMFSRRLDFRNLKMSLHALIMLPKLYIDFALIVRKKRPDILFFANHHELILLLPMLLFQKRPIICHMHDPSPAIRFQRFTFKWYSRVVDSFVAISHDVAGRLGDLGCAMSRIQVIHNGVSVPDPDELKQSGMSRFGFKSTDFVLGIAGQMTLTKGHLDVLMAFGEVHKVDSRIKLLIGSKKVEPLYSILTKYINDQGLQEAVLFTDWLPSMNKFYAAIDLFILASRHKEGYGLVVAEAMAAGVPALITDSGGAVELIENDFDGWIVPRENPGIMANKIIEIARNSDGYKLVKSRVRSKIINEFSIEVSAERLYAHCALVKKLYGVRN